MSFNDTNKPRTLAMWLSYIENLDQNKITLGLDRILKAATVLGLKDFSKSYVITVAGTNGKGTSCHLLAKLLQAYGFKVGLYTSPHLHSFTERVQIDNKEVEESLLVEAFDYVQERKGDIALSYFEYTTLAAFYCFLKAQCDIVILEVGLGGRLDATNIIDANLALITSIDYDHTQFLGNTLEAIAKEKAAIIKKHSAVLLGDMANEAYVTIQEYMQNFGHLIYSYKDLAVSYDQNYINLRLEGHDIQVTKANAPVNSVVLAIAALYYLSKQVFTQIDFKLDLINKILGDFSLQGRMSKIANNPTVIVDVAHNEQAARLLASNIANLSSVKHSVALIGMLKDKDIDSVCKCLATSFDRFYVASLNTERGAHYSLVVKALEACNIAKDRIHTFDNVALAFRAAYTNLQAQDSLYIFGSFVTVSQALQIKDEIIGV